VTGCASSADAVQGSGPLGGLAAALQASPHQLVAAIAVDMPWVDPRLLLLLLEQIGTLDACVPVTDRGPEPLHAVYSRASVHACEAKLSSSDPSLHLFLSLLPPLSL